MPESQEANLFHAEYEHELESWLRRRYARLCLALFALEGVIIIAALLGFFFWIPNEPGFNTLFTIKMAGYLLTIGWVAYFYFSRRRQLETREQLVRAATWMILGCGLIAFAMRFGVELTGRQEGLTLGGTIFLWHLAACAFLPWTMKESLKPILPLWIVWISWVFYSEIAVNPASAVLTAALSPLLLLPGLAICAYRLRTHSAEFHAQMAGRHLMSLRHELGQARRIHESMFPAPYDDGHVRVEYTYIPQRDLGGDYLSFSISPTGRVSFTLLDVTGHGLAAAMTVNRLFGEIERIRGENALVGPGETLALLNRYVNLTLAKHNIYVTAVCLSIDPYTGKVVYANAGHPPVFHRCADGAVHEIHSTSVLLGAATGSDFDSEEESFNMRPGDTLLIYTDGAFETRNRRGEQLGLPRLRDAIRRVPPPRHWPLAIAGLVQKHSAGRPDDDILVASITFVAPRGQSGRTAVAAQPAAEPVTVA